MSNAKCVLISVAASAFMLATATLNAANPPVQRSMAVQFSDLNLERPGDVAQLYQRRCGSDLQQPDRSVRHAESLSGLRCRGDPKGRWQRQPHRADGLLSAATVDPG
jgi:UrcA family protein